MKQPLIQLAAAVLLLGTLPAAQAVPTLTIELDGAAFECADGDYGCDILYALPGIVSVSKTLGDTSVSVTTGLSKPLLSGGNPLMDLASLNVVSNGAHTLVIKFSDNDFNLYGGRFGMEYGGTLSVFNGSGASLEHSAYYDASNALFGEGTLIGKVGPYGTGPFSGAVDGGVSPNAPYSVTEILTLKTAGGMTTFSGDFEVNVPEPTTLALLAVALLGFAAVRRRRQPV